MQSANPDNFFQTDAAQAQRDRKAAKAGNKNGDPISTNSKILAAVPDPWAPSTGLFIAQAAGSIRRMRLGSSDPVTTYRGPQAPITCLAIGGQDNNTIFAGCWDKDIWTWDVRSASTATKLRGHTDFVKTVITATISGKPILLSGAADKKIMVWDTETSSRIHTIQDASTTMLAVQHLAIDPILSTNDAIIVASAGSDPHIRRWKITLQGFEQLPESFVDRPGAERLTIEEHHTSVYRLVYDTEGDDGDLWTASADGTSKCLSRARNFVADEELNHGDFVKAVVVTDTWVVTAGRDENVKVWDRSTGKLYCTLEGHFEEVTDLVKIPGPSGRTERVCSVSIDGTIRTWPLAKSELDEVVEKIKASAKPAEKPVENNGGLLTAEEEAELAELMD